MSIKIATWNVNSVKVRLPHILKWLDSESPDILAIQETKTMDDAFPETAFTDLDYHIVYAGQRTYNGVAIISRHPINNVVNNLPEWADPQRRILVGTVQGIRIFNVYVPNGQMVDSEKYQYKLQWLKKLKQYLELELKQRQPIVVLGDFNIAPENRDVHDPEAWEGQVLVSPLEREAFIELQQLGFSDAFRMFHQDEGHYTWWDYRAGAFRRNHGLRIDHILFNDILANHCKSCHIDKAPRKWERPSDHAVVVAEFDL